MTSKSNDTNNKPESSENLAPNPPNSKKDDNDLKVSQLTEQNLELEKKILYLTSEMQNRERRHATDLRNTRNNATTKMGLAMIPVLESLEHATLNESAAPEDLRIGIENTLTMFQNAFKSHNIEIIDPTGQQFDPHFHEAMTTINDPAQPEHIITSVLQKGFKIGDHILRHARVIINKK